MSGEAEAAGGWPARSRRIVVFGDSIANGLGAWGRAYPSLVAQRLGGELVDHSATARQVFESTRIYDADPLDADLFIVAHGVTESVVRPSDRLVKRLPGKYKRSWNLDPRPYYSSRRGKAALQHAENWLRVSVKLAIFRFAGGAPWRDDHEFSEGLESLLSRLPSSSTVVVVGPLSIDDRYFPGSDATLARARRTARRVAASHGATFVDCRPALSEWEHYLADHFHPSPVGHERMAEAIIRAVQVEQV